jgi:hypothetical protein
MRLRHWSQPRFPLSGWQYLKETGRQFPDFGFDVISDLSQTAAFRPTLLQFQASLFQSLFQLRIPSQLDLRKNNRLISCSSYLDVKCIINQSPIRKTKTRKQISIHSRPTFFSWRKWAN